jgi:hypothetical protein
MRLCAALALVLVGLVVLTVKAASRPRHRAPTTPADDVAEPLAPPARPVPARPVFRVPRRAPAPVPQAPPPAAIGGHVHLRVGEGLVYVIVRPSDGDDAAVFGFASEEVFRIEGLLTGRRYDVEFSGSHVRTLKLIGVVAPAVDLDVALEPPAVIHVAVGFPRGGRCPIDTVRTLKREGRAEKQEEETVVLDPNNDECRFEIEAPSRVGQATVVAEGGGLVLEASVTIPEHGDPEPLCLNPPCRADPLEGQAQLRVILAGVDSHSPINATIVPVGDANTRYGCGSSLFTCEIEALPAGQTFTVTASGRDCRGGPVTVTIAEGDNDVSIPCVRAQPPSEPAAGPLDDLVDS